MLQDSISPFQILFHFWYNGTFKSHIHFNIQVGEV